MASSNDPFGYWYDGGRFTAYPKPITYEPNGTAFTLLNDGAQVVFSITNTGDIVLGQGMTPSDASRRLWEHLKSTFPQHLATSKLKEEEVKRLKAEKDLATTRDLLSGRAKDIERITSERDIARANLGRADFQRDEARREMAEAAGMLKDAQRTAAKADKAYMEVKEHLESIFEADGFAEVIEALAEARKWLEQHEL